MHRFILIIPIFALVACNQSSREKEFEQMEVKLEEVQGAQNRIVRQIEKNEEAFRSEVDELEQNITGLESTIEKLESSISSIENRLSNLEGPNNSTKINLNTTAFSPVNVGFGYLLISCKSADSYKNGFKLRLSIGNPNQATLKGLTINVRLFRVRQQEDGSIIGSDSFPKTDWENQALAQVSHPRYVQRQTINIDTTFPPGTWTNIEIVVSPAVAADMDELFLSLDAETVSLSADRKR